MESKINFDWAKCREKHAKLSKVEKIVIQEHFDIYLSGNTVGEKSSPELNGMYEQFEQAWVMSQMFTEKETLWEQQEKE